MVMHHASGLSKFRLGLVQMLVGADKAANLVRAAKLVKEAASNGAQVIALPVSEVYLIGTSEITQLDYAPVIQPPTIASSLESLGTRLATHRTLGLAIEYLKPDSFCSTQHSGIVLVVSWL